MIETPLRRSAAIPRQGVLRPVRDRCVMTLHTPGFTSLTPLRRVLQQKMADWGVEQTYIDKLQLTACEILTNLIKHPPQKAGIVHILLAREEECLVLDIADDATPFVHFSDFFRKSKARGLGAASTGKGDNPTRAEDWPESGFGLACILQHHTDITYRDSNISPDRMNHFIVREPITRQEPLPPAETTPTAPTAAASSSPLAVFLADSDPAALARHADVLERHYKVRCFDTAYALLEACLKEKPLLVISDLHLSDGDGITLRHDLACLPEGKTIPFVFLTPHAAGAHNAYINKIGIDDYLCKPVTPERLLAVVARLVSRTRQLLSAAKDQLDTQLTSMLHPQLPPAWGDWSIFTRSKALEAGGGDFILFEDSTDTLFAIAADVMGHGAQAKFFAYAYAGYLRSLLQMCGPTVDVADFLARVSDAVTKDRFLDNTMMTCLAFQLSGGGHIALAAAGHPPPLRVDWDRSGRAQAAVLPVAGPLPGLIGESLYQQAQIHLAPGARLVIATDGFYQAFGGSDALALHIGATAPRATDFSGQLWKDFLDKQEKSGEPTDDATVIVINHGERI